MARNQPLGIELVKRGIVSGQDIEKALKYQETHRSRKIGDILYIQKAADPRKLVEAVGEIVGKKGVYLDALSVRIEPTDYIPLDAIKKNKAIPFDVEGGKIKVAFADIAGSENNIKSIKMLMLNKGLVLDTYIAFQTNVEEFIENYEESTRQDIDDLDGNETTTEIIDNIIKLAIEKRASDIHVEPQADSVRIRFRIDGELFVMTSIPKDRQSQLIGRLKAISNMHQEKQLSQDGRILLYPDYNIRVSSQKNIYGEKFVLRLLKKNSDIRNIFELGYPYGEDELDKAINKRNSLTIMAAPTGEGKTTTLYSILDYLKSDNINITTIEDPVEIRIPGLNQIEIERGAGFSESLRTILRQDPDTILIGEIRDYETLEVAISASLTGHLVLSTVHTNSAAATVTRLIEMGAKDYLVASTLTGVIAQRLVRRLCDKCKEQYLPTLEEAKKVLKDPKQIEEFMRTPIYRSVGCEACDFTGYVGRLGVYEIMPITKNIKTLIAQGAHDLQIEEQAIKEGLNTLQQACLKHIKDGKTTINEFVRVLGLVTD